MDLPAVQSLHVHGALRSHPALEQQFAKALFEMSFDNPIHRPVLGGEGLRQWIAPQLEAYASLRDASAQQGFLTRPAP
jgi:hypothetical protein